MSDEESQAFAEEGSGKRSVKELRQMYDRAILTIQTELRNYWLNHAFLKDHQWLYWSEFGGRLEEVPHNPERVQATINKLRPGTRSLMSMLMQRPLVFEVMPHGADDARVRGARLAESVLRSMSGHHNWERLREELGYAVWKGGTAALCVDWEPGREGMVEGQRIHGDTYEQALNITQFVLEPGTENPEEARWWMKAVVLPPEDVQARFNLPKPPPPDAGSGLALGRQRMDSTSGGTLADERLTLVLTYYERPSSTNPQGRVVVIVDDQAVHDEPWPFPFADRLNLVVVRESPDDTRWTGDTALTSARGVQQLINLAWSSLQEHLKNAGNARMLLPESSAGIRDDLTDSPGDTILYADGNDKPEYLAPPQLPGWIIEMPNRLEELLDDIIGVHDISRGEAPRNIESGFGLSILAEKDSTPIARLSSEFAMAFGRLGTMVLEIYEAEVNEIRESSIRMGDDNSPHMVRWTGRDLYGQTTAYVPLEQILPRSRAAQLQLAKDMLQAGLIGSLPQFVAVAELPGASMLLSAVSPDIARARRENAGFALGRQSVVEDFDDHAAHIPEHNVFRKSEAYEMLSDEHKALCDEHLMAHEVKATAEIGHGRNRMAMDPALGLAPTAHEGPAVPELDAMLAGASAGGAQPAGPQQPGPPMPELGGSPPGADAMLQLLQEFGGTG